MFLLPGDGKGERRWPARIGKERGEQVVHFGRNAIELVAEPIVRREIGENFESVLCTGIEVLLAESAEIAA